MREQIVTADRLTAFSDAVMAVIITIMVLELKAPDRQAFSELLPLWPTAISYAVSYLFIVIIWINNHYLMRFVGRLTSKLIWINFAHLFMVSLLPFATAWIARTQLSSIPVAFYAAIFVCVDIAYNVFEREVFAQADATQISEQAQRMARRRSLAVLAIFASAMLVSFVAPRVGFGLVCSALILHLRPERQPLTHHRKDSQMSTTSTRLFLGFLAGFLSHLIFQGAFGSILYAAHLLPALPWSLMPVPPLGVPQSLSLGFWAGLWGLAYVLLERRLTARLGWWSGGLVFGLALPLVVYWFVVLPLKGFGIGGGFHLAMVPIEVGFHAIFGIGTAIIFRSGLVLARRWVRASPDALHG